MLSQQIRSLRLARKMSQVELASLLGVTKQGVSNWENDNIQPSVEMLTRIAGVFSVPTDCLLGLDGREYLDVSGLSPAVVGHLRQLVDDLRKQG